MYHKNMMKNMYANIFYYNKSEEKTIESGPAS